MAHNLGFDKILDRTPRQVGQTVRRRFGGSGLGEFSAGHPAVFVLSTGRVGTQTLAALLRSAPNLAAHHEPVPHLFGLSRFAYRHGDDPRIGEDLADLFMSLRQDLLDDALGRGRGYAETSPQVTFLAQSIHRRIPTARLIHLVRHPHDVIRSGLRRGWYESNRYDPMRITPLPDSDWGARWPGLAAPDRISWLWAETNRWILETLARFPEEASLTVKSEELFAGDRVTLADLFRFVGADEPSTRRVDRILRRQLNASPGPPPGELRLSSSTRQLLLPTAETLGYQL